MCFVDRKKLPFAGYSVVKEPRQLFSRRSRPPFGTRKTLESLLRVAALHDLAKTRRQRLPGLPSRSRGVEPRLAKAGGEYRSRTGDLLVANQALSQLS